MAEVMSCQFQVQTLRDWWFPFPVPQNTQKALPGKSNHPETALVKKPVGSPSEVQPSPLSPPRCRPVSEDSRLPAGYHLQQRIAWLGSPRIP